MSGGIIENAEELKALYLQTDITNVAERQTAIKEISENVYVTGKEKYIAALNAAIPATITKAQKYGKVATGTDVTSKLLRNFGWVTMIAFGVLMAVVDSDFEDSITTWLSLGFWVGVGVQVYISRLKNAWNQITLNGSVIHPAVKGGDKNVL